MNEDNKKKSQLVPIGVLLMLLGIFLPKFLSDSVSSPASIDLLKTLFFIGLICFIIGKIRKTKEK